MTSSTPCTDPKNAQPARPAPVVSLPPFPADPIVSVALATYNGARYLQEQLDSIARQTHLPGELVVGDDGSTDATLEILERFAQTAPFPVHIQSNSTHLGFGRKFLATLAPCRGDILFPSDQDDVWFEHKVATVVAAFQRDDAVGSLTHDSMLTDASLRPTGERTFGPAADVRRGLPMAHGAALAIRRDFFAWTPPPGPSFTSHDGHMALTASLLHPYGVLPKVLMYDRRPGDATSGGVATPHMEGVPPLRWLLRTIGVIRTRNALEAKRAAGYLDENIETATALLTIVPGEAKVKIQATLDQFTKTQRVLLERAEIRGARRWRRLPAALRLMRSGGYARARGFASLHRDLLSVARDVPL